MRGQTIRTASPARIVPGPGRYELLPASLEIGGGTARIAGSYGPGLTLQSRIEGIDLAIVNAFCIHAFIYRRSALERTGGYANDLPVLEDWDFNLRFLTHHDVIVVPQVLTNYHLRKSVTSGAEANSQTGEVDLHKFFESKIINDALRRDFATGQAGLGSLLSNATNTRFLERKIHALESKLKSAADKIGKIDARTKELKDRR